MAKLKKGYYGMKDGEFTDTAKKILGRAEQMRNRRNRYEEVWRSNIYAFVAFAVYEGIPERQFDPDIAPELQAYFNDRYSSTGFKFTDTRYPLEFAVIMRKMATEIPNLPIPRWIIDGETDQSPGMLFGEVYNQIMYEAESDYEDFELWLGKNVFGTSFAWSRMIEGKYVVNEPSFDKNDCLCWKPGEPTTIKQFKYSAVDVRNVLIDDGCKKSSLEDCEDCIVFEYLAPGRAEEIYHDVDFKKLGIETVLPAMAFQDFDSLFGGDNRQMYEAMHYYCETKDQYVTLINGKEAKKSAIPMMPRKGRKRIPLTMFVDHKVPGSPYGIGECTITKAFREIKNKNRNLIYDVTKKGAKPTIAVDPLSPFNEEKYVWGEDFLRVAPGDMQPIPVTLNLQPAIDLDSRTDNDVIIATGVNIVDTGQAPASESATKSVIRKESQVAVVELGLTYNTNVSFRRLHTINCDIIRLYLESPEFKEGRTVRTEGRKFFKSTLEGKDKFLEEKMAGSYMFKYVNDDLKYEFVPMLEVGNLAVTKAMKRDLIREDLRLIYEIAPDLIDPAGAGEVLASDSILPEKVFVKPPEEQAQDPDEVAKQAGAVMPPEVVKSNQFKNDQMAQGAAGVPPEAAGVGAGAGAPGVPPAGPV